MPSGITDLRTCPAVGFSVSISADACALPFASPFSAVWVVRIKSGRSAARIELFDT